MANKIVDVTGIGNAIVDVIVSTADDFLAENGIVKGAMTLADFGCSAALHDRIGPAVEISGGSAANTVVGLAELGGSAAFIGKVKDDILGRVFRSDITQSKVRFSTPPSSAGPGTARCLVMVTPDGQRSMVTYLGACAELGPEDIDEDLIASSKIIYLEGYLWDPPRAKQAFRRAVEVARASGGRISLTLSDPFCVDRHREDFLDLVSNHVSILFANEKEIVSLYQSGDFDAAVQAVRGVCDITAITRSEKGAVILAGDAVHAIEAEPIAEVVDSTGAGDLYAAGFLHGYCRGLEAAHCGRLGAIAAAEIISHVGARPAADLKIMVATVLGNAGLPAA